MKSLCFIILTIAFVFLLPYVSSGEEEEDKVERAETGYFLHDGVGARPLAMGGSFVAVADDATATYWNPAGIAQLEGPNISAMYADRFNAGLRYQFLNFVQGGRNSLGVSLLRLDAVDILHVTRRDALGHPIRDLNDTVKHSDNALLVTYGIKLSDYVYIGVTGKGIYRELLDNSAMGWGVDAGALIKTEYFSIGVNVQNIAIVEGNIKWDTDDDTKDTIPMNIKAGGAIRLLEGALVAAADVDIMGDSQALHLGGELWLVKNVLAVRGGFYNQNPSAGLGIRLGPICVDYALQMHSLGETHRGSIILMF